MITMDEARRVAGYCVAYAQQAPDADLAAAIGSKGADAGPFVSHMQAVLFENPVQAVVGPDGAVNWQNIIDFIKQLIPLIMPLIQLSIPIAGTGILAGMRDMRQQRRVAQAIYGGMNQR